MRIGNIYVGIGRLDTYKYWKHSLYDQMFVYLIVFIFGAKQISLMIAWGICCTYGIMTASFLKCENDNFDQTNDWIIQFNNAQRHRQTHNWISYLVKDGRAPFLFVHCPIEKQSERKRDFNWMLILKMDWPLSVTSDLLCSIHGSRQMPAFRSSRGLHTQKYECTLTVHFLIRLRVKIIDDEQYVHEYLKWWKRRIHRAQVSSVQLTVWRIPFSVLKISVGENLSLFQPSAGNRP